MKQLEYENRKLKQLVAEFSFEKRAFEGVAATLTGSNRYGHGQGVSIDQNVRANLEKQPPSYSAFPNVG